MRNMKKVKPVRALVCLLLCFMLLSVWALAEGATSADTETVEVIDQAATDAAVEETGTDAEETTATTNETQYMEVEVIDQDAVAAAVEEASSQDEDPKIDILDGLKSIVQSTGFAQGEWRQYVMIAVACLLLYLAIVKGFEPLLLLPISFGMLLANLPAAGLTSYTGPSYTFYDTLQDAVVAATRLGKETSDIIWRYSEEAGMMKYSLQTANGGLMYYLYHGVKWGIFPDHLHGRRRND